MPPLVGAAADHGRTSWRELLLLLATLLIGSSTTDAFVNVPMVPCAGSSIHHNPNPKNNLLFQGMSRDDHHHESIPPVNDDNIIKTHVVASDAMILPGEGMTLFMSNKEAFPLIQNCLNGGSDDECHRQVVVAVKLMTGTMGEIASLCEIQEISFGTQNEYVQVDLKCTGQVRLLGEAQEQYSPDHYLFRVECGVDATFTDEADLTTAIDLQNEIDGLMKHISEMEDQIQQELCEHHRQADAPHSLRPRTCFMPPIPLIDQYEAAKANVQQACQWNYKPPSPPEAATSSSAAAAASASSTTVPNPHDTEEDEEDRMLRLTATSWGVFLCLNDPKLEARYRNKLPLKLLDRIKLAQYALREKQLHLQGRLLQLQQEEEEADDNFDNDDDDQDSVVGVDPTTATTKLDDSNSINLDDYRGTIDNQDNNNNNGLRDNYFDDMDAFQ